MLNPDVEINRLRNTLNMRGYDLELVDAIVDAATADIDEIILDIVSSAMVQVAEYAHEMGVEEEFIEDMDIMEIGGIYQIRTKSGRTDFSTKERPMLSDLLKNAKTAKDGSRYKVIPIRKRSDGQDSKQRIGRTIFDDQRMRQATITAARAALNESLSRNRSLSTGNMLQNFKTMLKQRVAARSGFYNQGTTKDAEPEFRTVSDKQNAGSQWVYPAQDKNMTRVILEINQHIMVAVQNSVTAIIQAYEGGL